MPSLDQTIEVDGVEAMGKWTLRVKIIRAREMRIRIWIATRLIIMAALITGMGIEFVDGEEE